jgi:hypothetical protein
MPAYRARCMVSGLHAVVRPLASAMNDHPLAAVLRDAKRLREYGREDADCVHPCAAPEVAGLVGTPEAKVRRAIPSQIVEDDGAARGAVVRTKRKSDRLDRLSSGVGQSPAKDDFAARRKPDRLAVNRVQPIVPPIDEDAQRHADII